MRSLQFSSSPRGGAPEPRPLGCGPAGELHAPTKRNSIFQYPTNWNPAAPTPAPAYNEEDKVLRHTADS